MIVGINYYTWDKYFVILIINIIDGINNWDYLMFILLGLYIWVLYKHLFIYIDWDIGWDNSWDYAIYTLKRCQSGYFYLGFYYFTTFVLLELAILLKTQKLAKNKS